MFILKQFVYKHLCGQPIQRCCLFSIMSNQLEYSNDKDFYPPPVAIY